MLKEPKSRMPLLVLLSVALLALLLRVAISFFTQLPWYNSDTYSYKEAAHAMLNGDWSTLFPPGYSLLIALCHLATGGREDAALILVNVATSTALVLMAYWVCFKWTGDQSLGILAAFSTAIWPNQLNYVRQIMTEAPTAFLLMLSMCFMVGRRYFLSGISLGLAVIVRTSLGPVGLIVLLITLLRRQWKASGLILLGLSLPTVLAAGMSWHRQGQFSLGDNMRMNFYISLNSFGNDINFHNLSTNRFYEIPGTTTAEARMIYVRAHLDEPQYFFTQRLAALWELWGPFPMGADRGFIGKVLIGLRTPLLALALIGMWAMRKRHGVELAFAALIAITVTHTIFFATPRFTYVIEPLLIPLAAIGCQRIHYAVRRRCRSEHLGDSHPKAD